MAEAPHGADASLMARTVNVTALPARGLSETILADAQQRAALAQAYGLASVDRFEACLNVKRWHRDGVRVTGTLVADIVQTCVATLAPVPAHLDIPVDMTFVPTGSKLARPDDVPESQEIFVEPEGSDMPERFEPPHLPVGAIAEECFALALDPYPRAPDAEISDYLSGNAKEDDAQEEKGPFAELLSLRDRLTDERK